MILITPNVYCLENTESSNSETAEESNTEANINSEEDSSSIDEEKVDTETSDQDMESVDETDISGDSVEPLSTSEETPLMIEGKAYLDPTLENENDYFDTSLFTGSFVYMYLIETVKGRANLEPTVSLTYSSSLGSKGTYGSLGVGWSLNDNCIVRDTNYTVENTNDDKFILVLDGSNQELIYVEEEGSYHTETESFMNITKTTTNSNSFGECWIVKTTDGTIYRFGYNNDSEQRNSISSREYVSKWWLDLIEDVNGNQIKYNYVENPRDGEIGSVYLDNITYNDDLSVIDFDFENKPHVFTLYEYGNKIIEKNLLSSITIKNNGSILWKYELNYEERDARDFLTSISKIGLNGQAFPSVEFAYYTPDDWASTTNWIMPTELSSGTGDSGVRMVDVNGDGLVDVVKALSGSTFETWINTGSGWTSTTNWIMPVELSSGTGDSGVRMADVNGDGLVDVVKALSGSTFETWINTGSGWTSTTNWIMPVELASSSGDSGVRMVDVNGDGLVDVVKALSGSTFETWINTGSGWTSTTNWIMPVELASSSGDSGVRMADVNGDGLVDVVKALSGSTYETWINTGSSWESTTNWVMPAELASTSGDTGVRMEDVNGDGLVDVVKALSGSTFETWINTGSGWTSTTNWIMPAELSSGTSDSGVRMEDVNGDGLVDVVKALSGSTYETWINTNKDADIQSVNYKAPYLMKEIHHSSGSNTTVSYVPSTKFDNTGNDNIADLPLSIWVTSQLIRDNGISGAGNVVKTTNYSYKNGMQYFNSPEEIEFRGFGEVTVENDYSITKHLFHQDEVMKGIENYTEVWDKNGNIYSASEREYTFNQTYPDVNLILLSSESIKQFDGLVQSSNSSIGWSSFTEYEEYDDYGNPLSITDYGDVDIAGDERHLHFEYVNEENPWIIGKKTHEWLEDSSQIKKSESWYYYDDSSDNSNISKGELTKIVSWNNIGNNPIVLYNYDNYGNIIQITDPRGFSENIDYDENRIYPISIENPLGQKEFYEYNDLGRITKIIDSNGISTEYVYDDLHRIKKIIKPYDNPSLPSIEYTYDQDGLAPENIHTHFLEYNGTSKESNPYPIYTISDLQAINNDLSAHYILMNDIDASETSTWNSGAGFVPIGTSAEMFTGSIDGKGYKVDGLTINREWTNAQGFVAYLGDGGEIKNLGLTNISVLGYQYVGSLAVFNHGTISNCFSTGSVTGRHNNVGGLVAGIHSTGSISDSYSMCAVTCAGTQAGGLSGFNSGNIARSYATGFVDCSSTKGGITGTNSNTVTGSYYDFQTTGCSDTGKGTPKTTTEMWTQSTFVGWDFIGVWSISTQVNDGYPYLQFASSGTQPGDGTASNPYHIYDVYDLQAMNGSFLEYYILMNDIDATETRMWNDGAGFDPIQACCFLNGNGHNITNLYIYRPSERFVGLFESGGDIYNLNMINVNVTGNYHVGGLAGEAGGTFSNIIITGNVTCITEAGGGLSGAMSDGIVKNVSTNVNVNGDSMIGGLSGYALFSTIANSKSMGNVKGTYDVGGLLGSSGHSTIQNCYSVGHVVCGSYYTKGGLIGTIGDTTVTSSYYDSQKAGCSDTGKGTPKTTSQMQTQSTFVGWDFYDTWVMKDYPELRRHDSTFESIDSYDGFGQTIQKTYEGENGWITQNTEYNELGLVSSIEVPHYIYQSAPSVTYEYDPIGRPKVITNTDNTTLSYYYELENITITNQNGINKTLKSDIFGNIINVYEFNEGETYITGYVYDALDNLIEIIPNSSSIDDNPMQSIGSGTEASPFPVYTVSDLQVINNNLSAHYILMNNIDASATSTWNSGAGFVPIGTSTEMFTGSIDGNGYEIDGLTINREWTNAQGFVAYLGDGGEIRNLGLTDVSVLGYQYVGSLAVFNHGTISDCFSTGSVTGRHNNVGGLVAGIHSTGSISDSYSMCAVTCAGTPAGGLSGFNNGNIARSYATGFVACSNTKGGITGINSNTVTGSYYDSQTTGCSDTGKGTPKTTAEMQTQSTFVGWDFTNTWTMQGYPKLKLASSTSLTPHVYFTYDSLGRKVAMSDPDMGDWTYEYDLNDNLINQTDARGVSIHLTYDSLDRATAIDYLNDADVSFTYDLDLNGTLSQVTKGDIVSSYDYDQRYRIVDETITLDSAPYTTSYEYDSMDRVTRITYPDASSVDLTYNEQTLLESVEGVIDNLDYNARNQITTKELSNGVVTTYTYDTDKLLLDRIYTESLQDLNYEFDNVGNILQIQDNVMNSVKIYGYDDLDRLTRADMSVNSVPTYQRDFTYDQYGCIQQVDENNVMISSYGYSLVPFHAPSSYNGNNLDYDSNGNLIEDEDFIYVYNDANQLSEVRYSGNNSLVEKYWYNAGEQRVKKQNADGEFTYYVNKFYEVENGTPTNYFFRDDERIAKQTAGGMEWYLSDHLGSTTVLINESGLEIERTEYYPYGQVQSGGLEKYGFTGQENDADTGLMYYGARYYSPEYRIFVQPDSMIPDPYNPQYLNRYAYVLNNPVMYTDPSGHVAVVPALVGAGLAVVTIWSYYDFVQATIAWNKRELSTNKLMANAVLTLPITGGGAIKLSMKLGKSKKVIQTANKGFKSGGIKGGLSPFVEGISVKADDIALYIATDGVLGAGSYAVNHIDSGVDATIVENTVEGTRLGDVLKQGSSTKSEVSLTVTSTTSKVSSTVTSTASKVSNYVSSTTSKVSSTVSNTTSKVSNYVSSVKTTISNKIKSLFRR
ncbi:toxin TcdB middle/N-terminal domain-containing protein [Methanolobus sp.]|uniref:toxin TcdB middle/N-terminal domain-containing protein n=1 Tax=Methanolobus sp. TaxID=1874737 RepID=UPI0025D18A62|nr:toxin TcdB middle/N-terminal domain-containing protein [Methanolobus sp.]